MAVQICRQIATHTIMDFSTVMILPMGGIMTMMPPMGGIMDFSTAMIPPMGRIMIIIMGLVSWLLLRQF